MGDLKNPKLMYLKGFLFLVIGLLAAAGLLVENLTPTSVLLLCLVIWSFCRLYYFMFYVIEHYIDGEYKFAGISSFLIYLWQQGPGQKRKTRDESQNNP
jgi:hypothetical protein